METKKTPTNKIATNNYKASIEKSAEHNVQLLLPGRGLTKSKQLKPLTDLPQAHVWSCRAVLITLLCDFHGTCQSFCVCFFFKRKCIFHSDWHNNKLLKIDLTLCGIQMYDFEEQKCSVKLKWQSERIYCVVLLRSCAAADGSSSTKRFILDVPSVIMCRLTHYCSFKQTSYLY